MVKKQKSGKQQVRKDQKGTTRKRVIQDWEMQRQENQILVHILSAKYPVTASQLEAEIGIKQPIAFKILKYLQELGCVEVSDEEQKLGPKRVYYAPTIDCLYYTCFLQFSSIPGKTIDERIRKITTIQKFDAIIDRWIKHSVFSKSLSQYVDIDSLTDKSTSKDVMDALKAHCKLIIKCQDAYEEVRNDLPMVWRNMIGGAIVSAREPTYHKNTIKELYKYIKPVKAEIDQFTGKSQELANEYKNEK